MTQEQALEQFKALFPERAQFLQVERIRCIGYAHGWMNTFRLCDCRYGYEISATSHRSWEHALAIARSGNENIWPEDNSPIDEDAKAVQP